MDTTAENFAPYAAPENVVRVLERVHKNGLKGKLDDEFLAQLGIGEGMIPRTLRALEFLRFRDKDGDATELLNQYIVSDEDQALAILQETIRSQYEMIFRAVDPATDERSKIRNAFRMMRPQGQWDRMVVLFLGLCRAAGMQVKDPPSNRPGKDGAPRKVIRRQPDKPKAVTHLKAVIPPTPPQLALPNPLSRPIDPALASIVSKVGELETMEDLDAWYTMFRAAFQYVKRIR